MVVRTKDDLQMLIDSAIGESTSLEYKSAPSINDKDEIGKDVSAMANAAGGTIIYGMAEFDNKPSHVDPIKGKGKNKEYLDQVIGVQVRPKLDVQIFPIEFPDGFVYVVDVPQGETAHQAKFDLHYHRRRNFTTYFMEDFEVRDIMNRSKNPKVELKFNITGGKINGFLFNSGSVFANHVQCICDFPRFFISESFMRRHTSSDGTEYTSLDLRNGQGVLFAKSEMQIISVVLDKSIQRTLYMELDRTLRRPPITWKIWADNSFTSGDQDIKDVPILDIHHYNPR